MAASDRTARGILLAAVAEAARSVFWAETASVALLDERTGELVFEAVTGDDATELLGGRFPAEAGIAGDVLRTGRPLAIDDVERDPRFARDVAAEAGHRPDAIAVAPISRAGRVVGVLSVLDWGGAAPADALATLGLLARHAEQALELAERIGDGGP
jgi:GAF domain-containing protein